MKLKEMLEQGFYYTEVFFFSFFFNKMIAQGFSNLRNSFPRGERRLEIHWNDLPLYSTFTGEARRIFIRQFCTKVIFLKTETFYLQMCSLRISQYFSKNPTLLINVT